MIVNERAALAPEVRRMVRMWQSAITVCTSAAVVAIGAAAAADAVAREQAQIIVEQALKELASSVPDIAADVRVAGSAGVAEGGAALALAPAKKLPGRGGALDPAGGLIAVCACLGNMPGTVGKPKLAAGAYLVIIRRAGKQKWTAYYVAGDGKVAASSPVVLTQLEAPVSVPAAKAQWEKGALSWSIEFPAAAGSPPLRIASDLLKPSAFSAQPPQKEEQPPPEQPPEKKSKKKPHAKKEAG